MNKEPKLGVSRGGKRTLEEIQGTESNREEHNSKFVKQYSLKWQINSPKSDTYSEVDEELEGQYESKDVFF